jgi:hypothetical protein
MMLVYLEPSLLSFDPFRIVKDYTLKPSDELQDFKTFLSNLDFVLDEMEKLGYKISVSREFWNSIMECIPVSVYGSDTRYALARELYIIKIPRFIKKVHNFGDHNIEGEFEGNGFAYSNLLENNIYQFWLDLLLANNKKQFPQSILKSKLLNVFTTDKITVVGNAKRYTYSLHDTIEQLCDCQEIGKFELKEIIKNAPEMDNVECHGTGTHSSMWGLKINNVGCIPLFERELFLKLLATKLISRIVFLNFDNQTGVVASPSIKILEIIENESSDNLHAIIFGRGLKQNSQTISIQVRKGMAKRLARASGNNITHDFLVSILED